MEMNFKTGLNCLFCNNTEIFKKTKCNGLFTSIVTQSSESKKNANTIIILRQPEITSTGHQGDCYYNSIVIGQTFAYVCRS